MSKLHIAGGCIGCTACINSCPKSAITIEKDCEGFLSAIVEEEKCVECGVCLGICPVEQGVSETEKFKSAYACYINNSEIQNKSTSGGIFYSIAKSVLDVGGYVYGATMENMKVRHIAVDVEKDLAKLQGSKYVQSELGNVLPEIKKRLDNGEYVLFSGTGCQVAGLKLFLKNDYEKLLTIDLVCHGIPSPGLFDDYTDFLGRKNGGKLISYKFRQKNKKQAQSYDTKLLIKKGSSEIEKTISGDDDPYTINYLQNVLQNKECYRCKFASLKRTADITMGDYWGIDEVHPGFSNGNSVSLILLNSYKGEKIWDKIKTELSFVETDEEKLLKHNHQLSKPAKYNPRREEIYSNYYAGKFDRRYYKKFFVGKEMNKYLLKRKLKKMLKGGI